MAARREIKKKLLVLLCVLALLTGGHTMAAGEGDGGGGGPAVPLELEWSFPANGETGVSVYAVIQCKFSHNVAHFDVATRNAGKFTLTRADGTGVAITVYLADAQIEFDKRQYVYLYPKQELEEFTTYLVTAEEGVQAKNGMAMEETKTFCFTTGSKSAVPVAVATPESASPEAEAERNPDPAPDTDQTAAIAPKGSPLLPVESVAAGDIPMSGEENADSSLQSPSVEEPDVQLLQQTAEPVAYTVPKLAGAAIVGAVFIGAFCLTFYRRSRQDRDETV